MRRFGWQLTVNYLRVVPIFYSKSSHILPAMPPRTKRKLNKKTSDDEEHSDSDGDTVKQPCKYGDSCYRKNPDHLRKYSHSDSSAPPAKSRKLNHDDEDPNSWTVVQLRAFLKENGHTTSGTKVDLVKRVNKLKGNEVSDSDSGSDEEASASEEEEIVQPKTRASTSAQAKKKESQEDLDGEQEEENNGEAVIKNTWEKVDTVFYCIPKRAHKSSKIASFDMDSTLIETKSGKTFPTGATDWKWLFPGVPKKLKALHDEGYSVVIFSNQGGITKNQVSFKQLETKINAMMAEAKVPIITFLASDGDDYRKPYLGMFNLYEEHVAKVDKANSYYIGDAAGRGDGWKTGRKKDFSCGDRKFASNIGLPFQTPEEFFLGEEEALFSWGALNPKDVPTTGKITENPDNLVSSTQEIIVMVGCPASGKSTFAKTYLLPKGYAHINRDTLSTMPKCKAAATKALEAKQSVVIDNTNPNAEARRDWIALAKQFKVPIRCYQMLTDVDLAKHLNTVRAAMAGTKPISSVAYNVFKGKFQEPKTSEGFTEVKKIKFIRQHPDDNHRQIFEMWTEVAKR